MVIRIRVDFSEEHKGKISLANKGRHFSEEHRRNLSLTHMGNYHSEGSKQRIRFANLGEKNNSWKGDDVGCLLLGFT